ncbi:MAG: hypothetical protein AAF596_09735, partial [Planctomycetota bacterium]
MAESAPADFTPVSDADYEAAVQRVADASDALEKAWQGLDDRGDGWRLYLGWDRLQPTAEADAKPKYDASDLQGVYEQLTSGAPGLELPVFQRAAEAVLELRDLTTIRQSLDQRTVYDRQVKALRQLFAMDRAVSDPRVGYQLERRLDLITGLGDSPALAAEIKQAFNEPNLLLTVSEPLVGRVVNRSVRSREPIRDMILGARVVGTGDTDARLSVDLDASGSSAAMTFRLEGSIHSETTGYRGPIAVRSSAETPITASKAVEFSPEAFVMMPTAATASTRSTTRSILGRGGRVASGLIRRLASSRVSRDRPRADSIASRNAEGRVQRSFDERVAKAVRQARKEFDENWTKPLARHGATPADLSVSSSETAIEATLLQAGRGQLAAAAAPAPAGPDADAVLRVHASAVHNLGTAFLGGAKITKSKPDKPPRLSVILPPWLDSLLPDSVDPPGEGAPPFRPWSMTLRSVRPLSVEVLDDAFLLHLHTAEIVSGGSSYRGWDISLTYALVQLDDGWRLERRGEIGVLPSSFDPKSGKSLRGREIGLRRNLAKALNDASEAGYGVPDTFELPPI